MMLRRLAPPENPTLTLDDAKLHLRVDNDVEDLEIDILLQAAIDHVEAYTTRVLASANYEQTFDEWSTKGYLELGVAPIREVESVKYMDANGTEQIIDTANWYFRPNQDGGRVYLASTYSQPTLWGRPGDIKVTFTAGYNAPGQASEDPALICPARARSLVLMILGGWYANREHVVIGSSVNELPMGAQALLNSLRIFR